MSIKFAPVAAALSLTLLTSCALIEPEETTTVRAGTYSESNSVELAEARSRLSSQATELERQRTATRQLERELAALRANGGSSSSRSTAGAGDADLPPNAKPGECYARVILPAKFESTTERVLVRDASEKIDVIPATYKSSKQRVLVREASTRLEVVPATYKTIQERVLVRPAGEKVVQVPAEYKTVTERVLDKPAYTMWKRSTGTSYGSGAAQAGAAAQIERFETAGYNVLDSRVESTGEVMCLVEVPATYRTISKKVLVRPASTQSVVIPAEYRTITKEVIDRPATTREVTIPAEYKTITVQEMATPSKQNKTVIPAQYDTVTKTTKISDESIQWTPVLCDVNMTTANVSAVQRALRSKAPGCWTCGNVDGVIGPCTLKASKCYADKRGLASGEKFIGMEVVRSLGVKLQ